MDTAIEVKATTLARFTAIELTANEWTAALAKGPAYAIALVTGALTAAPRIAMLWDPAARVAGGSYQVEPVSYRLVHTEEG